MWTDTMPRIFDESPTWTSAVAAALALPSGASANHTYDHKVVRAPGWYSSGHEMKGGSGDYRYVRVWAHVTYISAKYMKIDRVEYRQWHWGPGKVCGGALTILNPAMSAGSTINHRFHSYWPHSRCHTTNGPVGQWNPAGGGRFDVASTYWYRGGCVGGSPLIQIDRVHPGALELSEPTRLTLAGASCVDGR